MRLLTDPGKARSQAMSASVLQTGGGIAAAVLVYLTAPLLLKLFWGSVDKQALDALRAMVFLFPVLGINAALALNYLLPMKRDRVVVGAAVVGSLVSVGLLFLLASYFGPLTGVCGVIAGELVMTIIMAISLVRDREVKMLGQAQEL